MKKISPLIGLVFLLTWISLSSSCKKDKTAPTVTTEGVTDISYTSATSSGIVTGDGGSTIVSRGICWNTSPGPIISNNTTNETGGIGSFTSKLTNLSENTKYFVKAYAVNGVGTSYGDEVTFTTGKVETPEISTTEISSISQISAISGGNITNDNGGSVTARGVCWSKVTGPTIADSKTTDGTGTGSFVSNLTGLEGGTIYYVRSYATNSAGTSYGNELTFTSAVATLPVITTTPISLVTATTALSGGNITNDGGGSISARGVCWSTSINPTTSKNTSNDGSGTGIYSSSLFGLADSTTYYLRAYATNNAGTSYGNEVSFTTRLAVSVSDIDQNVYKIVVIGSQVWMAQNLKTTKYQNGDLIGTTTPATLDVSGESTPKYQWAYNGDETNVVTYGRLYTWYTVSDNRNVCPAGWHVPSDVEWATMLTYLGGEAVAGGKLKEIGTTHWSSPNTGATNEKGFSGLPGGSRFPTGSFSSLTTIGLYMTATEDHQLYVFVHELNYNDGSATLNDRDKKIGLSVRCIKN